MARTSEKDKIEISHYILEHVPREAEVTRIEYEGPMLIAYNYSPNFLGNLKMSYRINSHINASIIANYVDKMETNWLSNPDGTGSRIGKPVSSNYTVGANLRFTDLFKSGLYFEIHGTNLLNHNIMYPATTNNNGLFPKGTVGMGRQIIFSLGYKF